MSDAIQIPYEQLSSEALLGLINEYVSREGTDYGLHETTQQTKMDQVKRALQRGIAVIVFDTQTESPHIMLKEQLSGT